MKKQKIRNKKINLKFFLSIVILILLFLILFFFLSQVKTIERNVLYTSFSISNLTGFDLNNSALTFGTIRPGEVSSRSLILQNTLNDSVRIIIKSKGTITNFLTVSENFFVLKPGETTKIGFSVITTKESELGKYDGQIIIKMEKI